MEDQDHPGCLFFFLLPMSFSLLFLIKTFGLPIDIGMKATHALGTAAQACCENQIFPPKWEPGRTCPSLWGAQKPGWAPCLVADRSGWQIWDYPGSIPPSLPHYPALSTARAAVLVFPCGSTGIKQGQWVSPGGQGSSIPCQPHLGTDWNGSSQPCLLPRVASWLLEDESLLRAAELRLLGASVLCWHSALGPWGCELIFWELTYSGLFPSTAPHFSLQPTSQKKTPPQITVLKPSISERIAITELWKGGEGEKKKRRNGFHGKFAGFNLSTKRRILTFFPCFRTGWIAN